MQLFEPLSLFLMMVRFTTDASAYNADNDVARSNSNEQANNIHQKILQGQLFVRYRYSFSFH